MIKEINRRFFSRGTLEGQTSADSTKRLFVTALGEVGIAAYLLTNNIDAPWAARAALFVVTQTPLSAPFLYHAYRALRRSEDESYELERIEKLQRVRSKLQELR